MLTFKLAVDMCS